MLGSSSRGLGMEIGVKSGTLTTAVLPVSRTVSAQDAFPELVHEGAHITRIFFFLLFIEIT